MSQSLLFEPGRPVLPARVIVFASGANESRDIRGFALADVSIGVSVSVVREDGVHAALTILICNPAVRALR